MDNRTQQSVNARYYVVDKVLEDAAHYVDWYEDKRDRILNYQDYDWGNALYSVTPPDRREAWIADLDAAYYGILNSDLIQNDDLSMLSGSLNQEYGSAFNPWTLNLTTVGSGQAMTDLPGSNATGSNNESGMLFLVATLFDFDDPPPYTVTATVATQNSSTSPIQFDGELSDIEFELPTLYGFSNRLRFRYNRGFSMQPAWGTQKYISVTN